MFSLVSGSNMAGKSTLLRTIGVNIALALAGGPVCATTMSLPLLRLRASMRVHDSLQRGSSYFHAELAKLSTVLHDCEQQPPVFFLLDELLRGTNAAARSEGARAVLRHLLAAGSMGVVATHDLGIGELKEPFTRATSHVHFTDVMQDGRMVFDYRLRHGPVKSSNALRLLEQLGISFKETEPQTAKPPIVTADS